MNNSDELARNLEDDLNKVYGHNFNLGGLSGFPFAGNTGFGAMSAHVPDDGFCLLVHGPHVGISKELLERSSDRALPSLTTAADLPSLHPTTLRELPMEVPKLLPNCNNSLISNREPSRNLFFHSESVLMKLITV
jgi:hypothetical protein